jgi:SPP1 gp7 family putative phage head morphogenesis protein
MSSREFMKDATTRHQVFIQRHAGAVVNDMLPFLEQLQDDVARALSVAGENANATRQRLNNLTNELRVATRNFKGAIRNIGLSDAEAFAIQEAKFMQRMVKRATLLDTDLPTPRQLKTAVFNDVIRVTPGIGVERQGLTIGQAINQLGTKKGGEIVRNVRLGYAQGLSNQNITKNLTDLVGRKFKRELATLVRTITNHTAATSKRVFYDENSDIIESFQIVATLDGSTSDTCAGLDSQVFSKEEFQEPPYHWNCRSTFIAVFPRAIDRGAEVTGTRSARGPDGKVVQVDSRTTYDSWLRDQPESFQKEVLGEQKFKAFKGGTHMSKFTDENFRPLSLKELAEKDIISLES